MHIAAVQANRQRQITPRQLVTLGPAALNEDRLFWTELSFEPLSCCLRVQPHGGGVARPPEWQCLGQLARWPYEINPENVLSR